MVPISAAVRSGHIWLHIWLQPFASAHARAAAALLAEPASDDVAACGQLQCDMVEAGLLVTQTGQLSLTRSLADRFPLAPSQRCSTGGADTALLTAFWSTRLSSVAGTSARAPPAISSHFHLQIKLHNCAGHRRAALFWSALSSAAKSPLRERASAHGLDSLAYDSSCRAPSGRCTPRPRTHWRMLAAAADAALATAAPPSMCPLQRAAPQPATRRVVADAPCSAGQGGRSPGGEGGVSRYTALPRSAGSVPQRACILTSTRRAN